MKLFQIFFVCAYLFLPAAGRAQDDLVFIVRPGDTERSLTENYLVRPTAWERVVQYNYLLKPGGTIKVPADLVRKEESAFLVSFFGEVEFRPADRRDWMPAVAGLILRKGDAVRTGTDSGAVLRMGRDDQVVLRGESEVTIRSLSAVSFRENQPGDGDGGDGIGLHPEERGAGGPLRDQDPGRGDGTDGDAG